MAKVKTITINEKKYTVVDPNAVSFMAQELDEEQQAQARENIGAVDEAYVDEQIATFDFIKVVDTLPETGLPNRFYLVPKTNADTQDLFEEFVWINDAWEYVTTKQIEIDLTDYVKKTDFATAGKTGVVRCGEGLFVSSSNGKINVNCATEAQINAKTTDYRPIVPSNLDYAVKTAICNNPIPLTDEEKQAALEWLGVNNLIADLTARIESLEGNSGSSGGNTVKTFTVEPYGEFKFEEGMFWADWVDSPYNTQGFWIVELYGNYISTDGTHGFDVYDYGAPVEAGVTFVCVNIETGEPFTGN